MKNKEELHSLAIHLGVSKTAEAESHTEDPKPGELVCKFQRPLSAGGMPPDFPPILVYNQDRSVHAQLFTSPEIAAMMGPDDVKAYAVCDLVDGIPVPVRRVKAQNW